jgi:uncharacterized membrane protein YdbT with pleckstrin-like domain
VLFDIHAAPSRLIEGYLAKEEQVVFDRAPDLRMWLFDQWIDVAGIVGCFVILVSSANSSVGVAAFLGFVGLLVNLVAKLFQRAHTRYVLTNHRVIRASGVFRRDHEWIAWKKVTDVSVHQSSLDRLFGTARIRIRSANESSGFAEMKDVPRPMEFAETIAALVNRTHGSKA